MNTTQLNHVALHVEDVARSCTFYRDVMRLESLPRPDFDFPGAWFRLGIDQELHLIGKQEGPYKYGRSNHFALMVDDIDAWQAHLECSQLPFDRYTRPDGAFQIFLADPDGHYIELCTAPAASRSAV